MLYRALSSYEKAAERRHVRLNGGAIDGCRIPRVDELHGLARQRDNVVSDNADADVVKVVVREVGDVPLGFHQRMALVAAATSVEDLPATLGRVINCVPVAGDEVIEGRIERQLCSFVGRDGAHQVRAGGRAAEDATEG